MCGIFGFIDPHSSPDNYHILHNMSSSLIHRGPDDYGYWYDKNTGVGLGHRRLSVIDLSSYGHQPMISQSGNLVLIYNGEIYNHLELKKLLMDNGEEFIGHSDTEILLLCLQKWGLLKTLNKISGMFSFALWDINERAIYLARDRVGEKPLYYGWAKNIFIFASELKSIIIHPKFSKEINNGALISQIRYGYISCPQSIYKNIWKLPPGSFLKISLDSIQHHSLSKPNEYWSPIETAINGINNPFKGDEATALHVLSELLTESVKNRMVSDVPVGAFLSGGVDSSTIVSIMQSIHNRPVNTFTIGFNKNAYNEAPYAKAVAQFLGTNHHELYVTSSDILSVIPKIPEIWDEPFSDTSSIPIYLLSKLTRENVTVSLSGDGGDELFGGYNRHYRLHGLWNYLKYIPFPLSRLISFCLELVPSPVINEVTDKLPFNRIIDRSFGDKLAKFSRLLKTRDINKVYSQLTTHCDDYKSVLINMEHSENNYNDFMNIDVKEITSLIMLIDLIRYLPGDILTKLDRATMAVSLEARTPFLDHKLIEYSWTLPLSMKINKRKGKWILRKLLNQYIPEELIERKKAGFDMPIDNWLRIELRDWAEDLLSKERIDGEGLLRADLIRKRWDEHIQRKKNWQQYIWGILMFESWYEHWMKA